MNDKSGAFKMASWQPLLLSDMDVVNEIADGIHTGLPERSEVFVEKVSLFPKGCRKLVLDNKVVGYGISHPWMLGSIPPLDDFLKILPLAPGCLYIHDVVVLPVARGCGAAAHYVDYIHGLAVEMGIRALALVSVYGTDLLWGRFGFQTVRDDGLTRKLASYGSTAKYMKWEFHV